MQGTTYVAESESSYLTFYRLQRDRNGRFADSDLARILYESTETPAQSSGQGISPCLRVMQIKTIDWARSFKACTLNEYRKFLGLKRMCSYSRSFWN